MDKANKGKNQRLIRQPNPLEALKDLSSSTINQMKNEVSKMPDDFMEQLLGIKPVTRNYSGELMPGESLEFREVFSGRFEQIEKARKQTALEKQLLREEEARIEKKTNELKIQLHAVREEILVLAQKSDKLTQETQIAAMQAPIEPGIYHVIFFEKLLEFIRSFNKKIEEAAIWLQATNKRAARKNVWGSRYQKYGSKYLLSGEHYLQRSAG